MVNIPVVLLLLLHPTGLRLVRAEQLESNYIISEEYYYRLSALRPFATEFAEYFANSSELSPKLLSELADSRCLTEMGLWMQGLAERNMWALKSKYYTNT